MYNYNEEVMGFGSADRCAKTITMKQKVTTVDSGKRVWANIIVTCNLKVGHKKRHAFRWTFPDPESWAGES